MSTVQTLRKAAHAMREQHPASHPRHEMWYTLAGLLDSEASKRGAEFIMPEVVRVAEAYLAAVARPDISEEL